jgi:hypothetical protein
LDTWLHETEALPWTVTFDPVAWHRRTPVHTLPHLTIEQAVLAAKSRDQRTQELDRQATEWLKADDSRALRPLTALKYGYLPDPSEAVEGLAEDARTVALGGRPSWMPSGVFELGGDQLVETIDKMSADAPTVLKP